MIQNHCAHDEFIYSDEQEPPKTNNLHELMCNFYFQTTNTNQQCQQRDEQLKSHRPHQTQCSNRSTFQPGNKMKLFHALFRDISLLIRE